MCIRESEFTYSVLFLVKWSRMSYSETTWEQAVDLITLCPEAETHMKDFQRWREADAVAAAAKTKQTTQRN